MKSHSESWPKRPDVTFPQCTHARAHQLQRWGKETAGPKNTHIIEQKINDQLRIVFENSSTYDWETFFFIYTLARCRTEECVWTATLAGIKSFWWAQDCFMPMLVNLEPRGLFALMLKCLKPSWSFVGSTLRL